MSKPANVPSQTVSCVPAWARNASKMVAEKTCAVLKRSVWSGCAACATIVLKAFFYDVPGLNGLMNTGLKVVCACMTLYLLLDGKPKTYPDLMQVCLPPCGFNEAGVMEGDGGAVQWTDKSFQEVLHYVCVMSCGFDQCQPQADEAVSQRTVNDEADVCSQAAAVCVDSPGEDAHAQSAVAAGPAPAAESRGKSFVYGKLRVIEYEKVLEYGGKTYCFGGAKRWALLMKLVDAKGGFVTLGRNLKAYFSNGDDSRFFFNAAIAAKGPGRKGNGQYRLKI